MSAHPTSKPLATSGHSLYVRMFGTAEIWADGAVLDLHDQKARALLFYLAATGHSHTRDQLATLLWSESPDRNARHSLRSCLHHLRQSLLASGTADVLVASRNLVNLHLPEEACDVTRFLRLVADEREEALAQAAALYHGPLLTGFTPNDAPMFEDWLRAEAYRLSQSYLAILARLADMAEERRDWSAAVAWAQRRIEADSLDEAAQRRLIHLYLHRGSPGQALQQYQRFAAELKRELDLSPSAETRALISQALRSQQSIAEIESSPPRQHPEVARLSPEPGMPFVGRYDLLSQLLSASQEPLAGTGLTILLHSEAGMGKTRLCDELAAQLSQQGRSWIVMRGACSPYDDLLSYGPFYDAFQTASSGDLSDMLAVEQTNLPAKSGNIGWRVLQALRALAQRGPILLVIDDLHWANSATLNLFGFLSARIQSLPVLLIGTIQHPESIAAIQQLLALGRSHGRVRQILVTPLDLNAVTELLLAMNVNAASAASLAEWLHEQSAGSPFIIGEMLAQLRSDAILIREQSGLQLNIPRWLRRRVAYTLPDTTHDLVTWRLSSLPPESVYLLDTLAVAGQPLPFALIHDLPGIQSDQSLHMVDDLMARGLLVEAPGDTIALPHHLLRESLLARLSRLRRRAIHRQLLQALEQCPALEAHFRLHQVALHAVAGEDVERARRYGLRVLDELLRNDPSAEALDFVRQLHELLAPTASRAELLGLAEALGKIHQALGQLEAAERWNQRRLEIAQAAADLAAEASAYLERAELALITNDYLTTMVAARAGLSVCERSGQSTGLDQLAGRGYRLLGAAQAMEGSDLASAEEYLQRAVHCHQQTENLSDLCADLFELGNVAAQRGELARALDLYREARRAAETGHVSYFLALAHNNFAYHSLLVGDVEAAQHAVLQGQRVAESHALVGALLYLSSTQGEIQLYLATWESAAQLFRHGLALAQDLGNPERQAGYHAGLALVAQGEGKLEQATALLETAHGLVASQGYWHLRARILLALADVWLQRKHLDRAAACLDEALAIAQTQRRMLLLIQGQRLHARLFAAQDNWPAARALFEKTLRQVASLRLDLEVARTQAAFGAAILLRMPPQGPSRHEGYTLLTRAIDTFTACDARADLEAAHGTLQLAR